VSGDGVTVQEAGSGLRALCTALRVSVKTELVNADGDEMTELDDTADALPSVYHNLVLAPGVYYPYLRLDGMVPL
jgi:hypothetical protein